MGHYLEVPLTTSTLTGVSTTVSGNANSSTLSQGSAMIFEGVPTSTTVTHTLSRPVNTSGTIRSVPGTAMGLNLPGSRPPVSYCGYMLSSSGTQPLPSWSQPPWPFSYPYDGFMPNQPGFWPYRDYFYGPPSGVATAPPLAPAPPVAVSLTPAVAPSAPVPDYRAQSSRSSHGIQGSDSAPSLDGFQKLLLDFVVCLLENRVSSHQPSPAKSVEYDEREDAELSVSPGSQERAFLTDEDDDSSSSPKVSKTAPEPSSKSARQPATKETEDPPSSLKDLKDKVYTLMRDEAHIPFASAPKPKRLSSTFEASCGIYQDSVTSHNTFPESGHMAFALQIINEGIFNSASEKVANNQISGFGMCSFSDQFKYKDFDIFDSSLGTLVPTCDKSFPSLLGTKPVDGLRLTQPVWAKTENLLQELPRDVGQENVLAWVDTQVVMHDCQSRLYGYKYVAVLDKDEFFVPNVTKYGLSLKQFLLGSEIFLKNDILASLNIFQDDIFRSDLAGVSSMVKMHMTSWKPYNQSSELFIGKYLLSTAPVHDRVKCVYMPSRTKLGSVDVHKMIPSGKYKRKVLPVTQLVLHHYRKCRKEYWFSKNMNANRRNSLYYNNAIDDTCFGFRSFYQKDMELIMGKIKTSVLELQRKLLL
ncbi:unnamed protein product [Mytilus coruscus]|uniref:Glycosyltransferase family 92 protein n=1 Tax=Mytilus coruscus TaxID=42192 RepID=A0A6J8CV66_MYTCO|nr:unnamed protein product [Mytilus coruscus]